MPWPVIVTALSLAAGALLLVVGLEWPAELAIIAVTFIALIVVFATFVVSVAIARDTRLVAQELKTAVTKNILALRQWWSELNR